ncbi:MAG TPA: Ig-like domain-containing protein [Solirubrobacteraceae bacterium]|nr:Ig-like domain-containing protein [Solirubrobacteraceae bacterium]
MLAPAVPAEAISRKQAANKALAALGSTKAGGPVIVFGLTNPLRAGSRITQEGSRKLVAKVGPGRAFFFYQDSGPFQPYPHPGRVALVGVKSGKAKLSTTFNRAPLVNGKLPAFLTNAQAYRSPRYRVFQGSRTGTTPMAAPTAASNPAPAALQEDDPFALLDTGPNSPPKAIPQNLTVKQNAPKRITLTGSDDDEGDLLTFHITKQPARGTLTGQPPDMTYTPDPGYLGKDHFTFKARDDDKDSNAAQVSLNVVPAGVAPTVTTSAGCTAYTEQGPGVVIDGQLTVSDPDDTQLDSAVVRIAANFQDGDNLLFTDQNGISSSYNGDTGVLSLTGTSSVANYQTALSSVRYRNLASGNATPTKDIEFTANDAGADSAPATKQVCITGGAGGTNNKPTGEVSEGGLSYIENDGPIPVDSGFVVGDPDSPNLSGATVKFVPLVSQPVDENGDPVGPPISTVTFAPAEDELAFTDQLGIAGSYDDTSGVLTLTGSASLADYETAIRAVTYENSSEDPSDATRRIQFQVTDSSGANSTPSRRDVFITPVNDAPEVTASEGSTLYTGAATAVDPALIAIDVDDDDLEGARITIASGLATGDELVFADQLGITGSYDADLGVLSLSGPAPVADYQTALRSVEFLHTGGDPSGERTVEFATNDGDLESNPDTKHVEVNDEPVLTAGEGILAYTENDGPVAVDTAIAATDPDSPTFASATVSISAGFSQAEDELAFVDANGISGSYDDTTGVLALSGTASVADYESALRSVTYENTSDDPSTARTVSFQVDDGAPYNNLSNTVTRDVAITPVNDAPEVATSAGSTAYTEGDAATAVDATLTVADVDDANLEGARATISAGHQAADALTFADQAGITGLYDGDTGVLTLSGTATVAEYETALRSIEYSHSGDDPSASKTVEFTVNDGELDSAAATKDIAVTAVNDKPVLDTSDDALAYSEGDGPVAVDPGVTAADPDSATFAGATVTVSAGFTEAEDELAFADANGISGAYDDTSGVLTLTGPASVADFEAALRAVTYENSSEAPSDATRTVTFQVDDGAGSDNLSDAVTRDVTVAPVNDAPAVATTEGPTGYTEGDAATAIDSGVTVADVDDANIEGAQVQVSAGFELGDVLTFADQAGIAGQYDDTSGVLTLSGTGTLAEYETALRSVEYSHTGDNPLASKTVEFTVNDGDAASNAATKDVSVTGVNDNPVLDTTDAALSYTAGSGPAAVDPGITATDADSTDLVGAIVTISGNFASAEDDLAFADGDVIAGSYDDTSGVLTLSGTASVADYEAALRSVTYANSSATPSTATRTVTFQADDGGAVDNVSDAVTRDVAVAAPNPGAPVVTTSAGPTAYTIGDSASTVDAALTVTDSDDTNLESAEVRVGAGFEFDGDELSFTLAPGSVIVGLYNNVTGVLTLTGSATVAEYQAALRTVAFRYAGENPSGTRIVEFEVNDGTSDSNVAMKTVDIGSPPI